LKGHMTYLTHLGSGKYISLPPTSRSFLLPFSTFKNLNNGQIQCMGEEAPQSQTESQTAIHRASTVPPLLTPSYHADVVRYANMPLLPTALRYPQYDTSHGLQCASPPCGRRASRESLAMERRRLLRKYVKAALSIHLVRCMVRSVHVGSLWAQREVPGRVQDWHYGVSAVVQTGVH
jgi:hypothetical protein